MEYCNIEWGKAQIGINPTEAKVSKSTKGTQPDAAPVKVTLYYESLCPDCKQFIQSQLWPTYQKLSSTGILDLEMVPYGNARVSSYHNSQGGILQYKYGALAQDCKLTTPKRLACSSLKDLKYQINNPLNTC